MGEQRSSGSAARGEVAWPAALCGHVRCRCPRATWPRQAGCATRADSAAPPTQLRRPTLSPRGPRASRLILDRRTTSVAANETSVGQRKAFDEHGKGTDAEQVNPVSVNHELQVLPHSARKVVSRGGRGSPMPELFSGLRREGDAERGRRAAGFVERTDDDPALRRRRRHGRPLERGVDLVASSSDFHDKAARPLKCRRPLRLLHLGDA